MAGPRLAPRVSRRLGSFVEVLFGGNKLTREVMFPEQKARLAQIAENTNSDPPTHSQFTHQSEANTFAIAPGIGLDIRLNKVLAYRLVDLNYTHAFATQLNGFTP